MGRTNIFLIAFTCLCACDERPKESQIEHLAIQDRRLPMVRYVEVRGDNANSIAQDGIVFFFGPLIRDASKDMLLVHYQPSNAGDDGGNIIANMTGELNEGHVLNYFISGNIISFDPLNFVSNDERIGFFSSKYFNQNVRCQRKLSNERSGFSPQFVTSCSGPSGLRVGYVFDRRRGVVQITMPQSTYRRLRPTVYELRGGYGLLSMPVSEIMIRE